MPKLHLFLFLFISFVSQAQIKGIVSDENGTPLSYVTIFEENNYNGTTSNEEGKYELTIKPADSHIIIFQSLGFRTQKITITETTFPYTLNVILPEESYSLNEVLINPKNNPANGIIREAIANKRNNSEKTANYDADFYSRGIFRIKEAPKTVLGRKLDMFDDVLDSTRSGILYLSETVSKITFQKPDKLKETIIASKVSGKDNGFSFNSAASVNYDFYINYLPFDVNVISPIADNAFNYYRYKLEGTFFDENNNQINKIKVTPKRTAEPVVEGYIYIVEDSWAIYAVDCKIRGDQIQNPAITILELKQNFSYNTASKIWVKNTQTIDFIAGMFGVHISGKFSYVYTNFDFKPRITKKTFTNEILSFQKNANKKDDAFWNTQRPIPLTAEESNDYLKKDILQVKKKSQNYLDSIDQKGNKFKVYDLIAGYTYKNSFQKWSARYEGILKGINFNTVQGWKINSGFSFNKKDEDKKTFSQFSTGFDYGFSENKLRVNATFNHIFNVINQSEIIISGGSSVEQFNKNKPIIPILNTATTLFFKDNFMKVYDRNFAEIAYKSEVTNGLFLNTSLDYSVRKPLFNTTDYTFFNKNKLYTSNNPLSPNNYQVAAIEKHHLIKAIVALKINFGQKYWSRPDGKFNIINPKYPTLDFSFEKGFAGNNKKYNYDFATASINYEYILGNKGEVALHLKAGQFFNASDISFVDYKHFNGNQTYIGQSERYLNVFNLLPYYTQSTNDRFIETHIEYNDKGFILNKIPVLNLLKPTLALGFHALSVPKTKPYTEFSIGLDDVGFGKFKLFRIDYIRSYQNGFETDGIIFGLKFLNFI